MAAEKGASVSQLVLQWTLARPGITIALVGARNAKQAMENAKAVNFHLSSDEIQSINEQLDRLELVA